MRISGPISFAAAATVVTAVGACASGTPAGNAEQFCAEIATHQTALTSPDLATSDQIEPLLQLYRDIGELAPLSIEKEWDQLTLNIETASTVVPGDAASEQTVIAEALRSENSAVAVASWVLDRCEIDLGPVATVAPQG